jgi:pimeloyl-ACP methyl ester carboxylesterase
MMDRRQALLACGALACSTGAGAQDRSQPENRELAELTAAFELFRARNARDYALTTPNAVDEARYIRLGGSEQWVTIRGENRANPVLLLLHGGPGDATNPWGYAGFRRWLGTYTVVQWDQRGSGRTLGRNGPASATSLTIDRMVDDGLELAESLRTSLNKEKIVLLGHSWGSVLGVLMAKKAPSLFHAFIGTGQVEHPAGRYDVTFDALVGKARSTKNARALRELEAIGPPPYTDGRGYQVQRRWANLFEGADAFIASMLGYAFSAPGYTLRDVTDWFDGQKLSGGRIIELERALPPAVFSGRFELPVFVIQGDEDFTTPTSAAGAFIDRIDAPQKSFTTIKGGHFAVFMNSTKFMKEMTALLEPIRRVRLEMVRAMNS